MSKHRLYDFISNEQKGLLSINLLLSEIPGDFNENIIDKDGLRFEHVENYDHCNSNIYDTKSLDTNIFHKYVSRTFDIGNCR